LGTLWMRRGGLDASVSEFVTETAYGLDHLAAGAQLAAQGGDVHVDGSIENGCIAGERPVDDLVAGENAAGASGQELKDAELGRREGDRLAVVADVLVVGIQRKLPAPQNR